jgi:dienelactone hydrolase
MQSLRNLFLIFCAGIIAATFSNKAYAAEPAIVQKIIFDTNPAPEVKPVKITATLYLPHASAPVPAMVIIHSSGGVIDKIEGHYARSLANNGIAALVVHSFTPRGVKSTANNQNLVNSWAMENDAFAALAELQKDKRIDPNRIGIMGVSKGGLVAQNVAFTLRQEARRTGKAAFALHVPIVPDCSAQFRTALTTGKPIFYMLGEQDEITLAKPCIEYVGRIKAAGNSNVTYKVYPAARHGWEMVGPVNYMKMIENYSHCDSLIEDNGDRTFKASNETVGGWRLDKWMKKNCLFHGAHVGGGTEKQKKQATDDLLSFLKQNGF